MMTFHTTPLCRSDRHPGFQDRRHPRALPDRGAGRAAGLCLAQPDPGHVLHSHDAGAGAVLEPACRLWRAGLHRPAGLCRHRRLRDVRRCDPLAWIRSLAILLGGVVAVLLAIPTAFFAFRLQGAYFAIGTWVIAEVVRLLTWRSGRPSAAARAPRCRARPPANVVRGNHRKPLRRSQRGRARHPVLLAGRHPRCRHHRRHLLAAAHQARPGLAAVRDNIEAAKSVGVDAARMKWIVFLVIGLRHRDRRRADLLQKARISPDAAFSFRTGRPM
jgi:hypothetical protein